MNIVTARKSSRIYEVRPVIRVGSWAEVAELIGLKPIAGGTLIAGSGSKKEMGENIVNKTSPQTPILRLFINNHTPADADNINASDYTEMSTLGYAAVTLTPSSWTFTSATPSVGSYPQVTYTFTAGTLVNVYGYYWTRTSSGNLVLAERFSGAPFPIQNTGDAIQITPQFNVGDA